MPTHDDILFGEIKLWQPDVGPRVNMDTMLLAAFVRVRKRAARRSGVNNFVELGSAAGAISLLLAQRFERNFLITGVEIQQELVALAERNRQETGLADRVKFLRGDLRDKFLLPAQSFDGLVVNPPYLCPIGAGGDTGQVSADASRAIARQGRAIVSDSLRTEREEYAGSFNSGELTCTLEDLADAGARLLKGRGLFFAIFRTDRLTSLLVTLESRGLTPKRLKIIYPRPGAASNLFLVECIKNAGEGLTVDPPLFVLDDHGKYTSELLRAYTHEGL